MYMVSFTIKAGNAGLFTKAAVKKKVERLSWLTSWKIKSRIMRSRIISARLKTGKCFILSARAIFSGRQSRSAC